MTYFLTFILFVLDTLKQIVTYSAMCIAPLLYTARDDTHPAAIAGRDGHEWAIPFFDSNTEA
jgi:hypothetical protein